MTSPSTEYSTSHLLTIFSKSLRCFLGTIAHMRSWLSLIKISSGVRLSSLSRTFFSCTRMPMLPFEASSLVAHEMPAPPRSWMPATTPAWKSSRQHSMSTFSANGSPTWTAGRLVGPSSPKVSEASTLTPPMPSAPVLAPKRITRSPALVALASLRSSCFREPIERAFTSGLPW